MQPSLSHLCIQNNATTSGSIFSAVLIASYLFCAQTFAEKIYTWTEKNIPVFSDVPVEQQRPSFYLLRKSQPSTSTTQKTSTATKPQQPINALLGERSNCATLSYNLKQLKSQQTLNVLNPDGKLKPISAKKAQQLAKALQKEINKRCATNARLNFSHTQ